MESRVEAKRFLTRSQSGKNGFGFDTPALLYRRLRDCPSGEVIRFPLPGQTRR